MSVKYYLAKGLDGLYICVEPDDVYLFPPSLDQVKTDLNSRHIPFEKEALENAYHKADGTLVKISDLTEGYKKKPILRVKVSQDKMKAYLTVVPFHNGEELTPSDVVQFLAEQKIVSGIKQEEIDTVIRKQKFYHEYIIAEGTKPEDGQNAQLVFHFNPKGLELKPQELEDGSVDFYNLNLIQSVTVGQVLVEKIPATEGINGVNVLGEEIKARPGRDVRLPQGQNTQPVDNYSKLVATKDGHVVYVNDKVNVLSTYEVRGDVDFSTGNIKFSGNVIVRGTVKSTFQVEAAGDVEIYGNLEGTVISESNIQVKKGIVRGNAIAKGSIMARYIENSQAEAGENITVAEAIMHSVVKAGRKVSVSGKKGLLVGGSCTAGEEIYAKNIGSSMGTSTVLEVGIRPEWREEYKEICRRLLIDQENSEKNQNLLNNLMSMQRSTSNWTEQKEQLLMKARRLQYQLHQEIEELSQRKTELEELFEELQNSRIIGENYVYSGVEICMGKAVFNVTEEMKQVMFTLDGLDIKHSAYVWRKRG